ncbi:MAG: toxin-antitoxin system YwqK family antitoxin, partial [Caldisphaera sp.]
EYYENGNVYIKLFYKDDKLNGKYTTYYENGNV